MNGFGTLPVPGAPALPIRIERVGIPAGAVPSLRILRVKTRMIPGLLPEPVPRASGLAAAPGAGEAADSLAPAPRRPEYRPDAAIYGRDADYPAEPVALGPTGRLRDRAYVELIYTPVQVNPVTGLARVAEEVELEIDFPLPPGAEALPAAPPRDSGRFEPVYREGLLNPDQAASFPAPPRSSLSAAAPVPDAGGTSTVYKLAVSQDGIYRISCASAGTCSVPDLLGLDPNTFRLRDKGNEVPMRVIGGADNSFDPGDVLEFYGQSQKASFTIVNCSAPADPSCTTPIYEYNDVTNTNVYLLDVTGSTARLRIATLDGTPGGLTPEPDFLDTAHAEVNNLWNPLGDHDPYYWLPTLTATSTTPASRDISVPMPGISPAAFTAQVTVRMRGVSSLDAVNPDHETVITLNGDASTTATQDWDGEVIQDQSTTASQSILTDPSTLHLAVPALSGISVDQVQADYVEISYRRLFQALSDRLVFNFPNQAALFSAGGFSGSGIVAYDISRVLSGTADTLDPRLIVNGTAGAGSLAFQIAAEGAPTGASRRFVLAGPTGFLAPDSVTPLVPNTLLDPTNEADYLIIAHPSLVDSTPGSPYNQFVSYLQNTLGLKVRLVNIGDIYDDFNNSIEHPEAIRSFLAYAHNTWTGPAGTSPPPSYLLLLGDAVWDMKNNLQRSDWIDLVPTPIMFYDQDILKYYAADNWLASFLGNDQSADILFGRIPARTLAQADTVFSKILGYAQSPPPGPWRSDGYFLADVGNSVQQTAEFEVEMDNAAANFVAPWTQTKQYYAEPPYNAPTGGGGPVAQYKADFVSHWNTAHPAIAAFAGHGAFDILGNDIFFRSSDVPLLTNGAYLPFFYNSDCLSGGFHVVGTDAIGETFLESSTGGSIAFFGPAGLSFTFIGNVVGDQLFSDLFSPLKLRELGTLTSNARNVLFQQGSYADMQGFTYLGDPSLSLILPAPKPPTNYAVVAGNARVDMSWTASADPAAAGTNIYRTTNLGSPYTKVNGAPVSGTSFTDTTVINGTTYFYRAVSVDSGGFEGAVTNTNADCGPTGPPDGPECRRAVPKNLTPPVAVQGVTVVDNGSGSSLNVSWNANPETDIQKYLVSYGTVPGSHPSTKDVGLATSTILAGLTPNVTYYLVVTAVNTSGVQGAPSAEASGTPHIFFGIAPPRSIDDLAVARSGNDLVLTWSAVTTNIYGNPATVDHYNVYRGSDPAFVPNDSTNLIAAVAATATPGFTHTGGALTADNGFYLVSAVDTAGFASGLGADLPAGILDLSLAPSPTAGFWRLSWSPVSVTVSGGPANISHYTLYGASTPVPRSLVGAGTLLQDNLTGNFVDVPDPTAARYYYNVIVVDTRGNLSPY